MRHGSGADAPAWVPDIRFSVGLDGLGLWLFELTALLMVTSVLISWRAIEERPALFYGMLLLLEFGCLGVFCARDIILFYVFFEFTLIPLFFLIGIWGSEERRYAAIKFFLFTLAGSMLTFLGLLAIVLWNYFRRRADRFDSAGCFAERVARQATRCRASAAGDLLGFAGRLCHQGPAVPPAHLAAAGSRASADGGQRLSGGHLAEDRHLRIPPFQHADVARCDGRMHALSVLVVRAGIIYGALVALAQTDIKRLIAYSSVSHLGFCMLGLFALNQLGVQGGALQMVNHGISTGALFALVGMMYERYHTREISQLSGLARCVPGWRSSCCSLLCRALGCRG